MRKTKWMRFEEELRDFAIVGLFAAFELTVKDHFAKAAAAMPAKLPVACSKQLRESSGRSIARTVAF